MKRYDDNLTGLTQKEVQERLEKYGYNELNEKEESWLHRLLRRFWGPIPWMIETAAVLSAIARRWEDFTVILFMLLVNAFVDFYQESKALSAIAVLKKKLARKALVLREGRWQSIDAKELVPDDIIKVKIGDVVPADCKLLGGGEFLQVDQSALTGESLPVNKQAEDDLYANAIIKQGEMTARVTATGVNTYFGKTVGLVAKAEKEEQGHFQKMVIKVGDFLIAVTIVLIGIIIWHGVSRGEPLLDLLIFALILTISAIPVAMPAVLTVTMALGARVLATKEAIVTKLSAIEEAAGMDILCSDKTGTLTQNIMSLAEPYLVGDFTQEQLLLYAAYASKKENEDPIEKPIFDYIEAHNLGKELQKSKMKKFIPFDPVHKKTEGVFEDGFIYTKGAPQVIIELCDEKEFDKKEAYKKVDDFAQKGFRTLGVAYKKCEEDLYHFAGLIPLFDPPREDSKEAIAEANAKGVAVKMVTGDNIAVAKYIAGILNIGQDIENIKELKGQSTKEYIYLSEIIVRSILKTLQKDADKEEIKKEVAQIVEEVQKELDAQPLPEGTVRQHESEIVKIIENADGFAQVFPEDKYFIVEKLQKADHIVGMTGDGVNDAPALKKADCGIAVSGATDAARAAADIVLMAPGLHVIVDAIEQARIVFERMKSYVVYRIAETIRILAFMTLAIVVFDFYPITAIMIILLALLNDIPIMAIAYDNTKVEEKPVRWDMKIVFILSSWLGVAGVLSSFTIFYITMVYLKSHPDTAMFLPEVPSWIDMHDDKSFLGFVQTLFFVKLILAGHYTIFNTRIADWFFKKPYPSWPLFLASFLTALVGTAIGLYSFGLMTRINWQWALFLWGYVSVWFVFNDMVKRIVVRYYEKRYGEEAL
ncbi:plasma-membrane proton-efflux P-type ATPase [Sulfurimonas sp. SWIR-19]|uniref:plasma-membrane proton-efflux P-type ATPase n=1 Tax=Sulfurimonas sp. SWIR-19 TaxID=2878390 RepID=UPI001CF52CF7|nr:plasma-membrane proton-efflux P-type ATPase [Sulfurimonas sp. SWIR-19]UCN01272.1 plasma-membrane proton-efflux P-type ATPase [Sulfurimonas sp. SWIR-19]